MNKNCFSIGCIVALAGIAQAQGIIQDAFGSRSVTKDSVRIYETDIDQGWQADYSSLWTVVDGSLQNAGTATSGIANEGTVAQVVTLSGQSGRYLNLAFDYTGNANNILTVHLWGYTGTFDGGAGEWFANFQAQNGSYYNNWDRDPSAHGYSLKDGSDSNIPVALVSLSGSGTYAITIDIQSLGIPGVTDVSDLTYINLGFGRKNTAGATISTVDNVNLYTGSSIWPIMSADLQSGQAPLTVAFDASASSADAGVVSYEWDFGDGNTATGVLATHTYTDGGIYSAELTITDSSNQTASVSLEINVSGTTDLGAIWFIGDSITQSNADGDSNGSPRKSLYDLLVANGYLFSYTGHFTANVDGLPTTGSSAIDNLYHYHSGISGSVIGDDYTGRVGMTENLSSFWNSGRLAEVKPDIILIMLGANDVNLALDLPGAPGRLKTFVETIYELPGAGNPTVFLAQITPNRSDAPDSANVAAFNAAVPDVVADLIAQGHDVRLVDQFTPINNDYAAAMRSDNLHPNTTGNGIMAQQWYNAITEQWPGTVSDFHGFDLYSFSTNGLNCKVAVPEVVADGRPWIWRARFWGHQPDPDIALLSTGFHVAYVDVADLFGSPTAVARFDAFYDFLTQSYGLDHRTVLEGMSRGGLIIYNWARDNTEKVHCIYADAPVCDFKSWPGGFYDGDGNPAEWSDCTNAYGFASDADALAYGGNPVDNMQPLAEAGIPLLHVVGDADTVVPVAENTAIVETRYKSFGGAIKVIHKPGVGHVHGLDDPTPIIDFILNAVAAEEHIPEFISGALISNNTFNVQFSGTTGQHYRVEYVDDLTTTNGWQVASDIDSLSGSPMSVSEPMTNAASFYRIHWLPW